jgi:hypothetical protein
MREKAWSTLLDTVHWRPGNSHLGIQIVHNWLRKSPYALCESCRGSRDLQLCYSLLGPLLFNFLEFWSVKQGHLEKKFSGTRRSRPPRDVERQAVRCRRRFPHRGPGTDTEAPRAPRGLRRAIGRRVRRPSSPSRSRHAPCAARPTTSSPYLPHVATVRHPCCDLAVMVNS